MVVLIIMLVVVEASSLSCEEAAAEANEAFGSTEVYDPAASSVEAYLQRNGLLVLCDGCRVPTFIQRDYRAVPGSAVGTILEPAAIRCAYPLPAATESRLDDGCGPHVLDAGRLLEDNVTRTTGVPCSLLFPEAEGASAIYGMDDPGLDVDPGLDTYLRYLGDWTARALGDLATCVDTSPACVGHAECGYPLMWLGPTSWKDFGACLEAQRTLFATYPVPVLSSWNEVVLDAPPVPRAVFWLNDTRLDVAAAKARAAEEARNLGGGVPLLVANFVVKPGGPRPQQSNQPEEDDPFKPQPWPPLPWPQPGDGPNVRFACDEDSVVVEPPAYAPTTAPTKAPTTLAPTTTPTLAPTSPVVGSTDSPTSAAPSPLPTTAAPAPLPTTTPPRAHHSKKSDSSGVAVLVIVLVFLAVAAAMLFGGYVYWRNQTQARMRNQVRDILAGYVPLDDEDDTGAEMQPTTNTPMFDLSNRAAAILEAEAY